MGLTACASLENTSPAPVQIAEPSPIAPENQNNTQTIESTEPIEPIEASTPNKAVESLPYPQLDPNQQIEELAIEVSKLQNQIRNLTTRIQQLERKTPHIHAPKTPKPKTKLKNIQVSHTPIAPVLPEKINPVENSNPNSSLEQAQQYIQQGNYQSAVQLLRDADSGGDGSEAAQQRMWLLLQSNQKLNKCQSVIQIGKRFASRFAQHIHAPQALFMVGQCQWHIQQQDIARETWRNLIRLYPNHSWAKQAKQAIEKK